MKHATKTRGPSVVVSLTVMLGATVVDRNSVAKVAVLQSMASPTATLAMLRSSLRTLVTTGFAVANVGTVKVPAGAERSRVMLSQAVAVRDSASVTSTHTCLVPSTVGASTTRPAFCDANDSVGPVKLSVGAKRMVLGCTVMSVSVNVSVAVTVGDVVNAAVAFSTIVAVGAVASKSTVAAAGEALRLPAASSKQASNTKVPAGAVAPIDTANVDVNALYVPPLHESCACAPVRSWVFARATSAETSLNVATRLRSPEKPAPPSMTTLPTGATRSTTMVSEATPMFATASLAQAKTTAAPSASARTTLPLLAAA